MRTDKFRAMCEEILKFIQEQAPKDTGNLAYNAIKLVQVSEDHIKIYVDCDFKTGIAPYMVYTNEPWLSEKWRGKQNPNEHWWNNLISGIIAICGRYGFIQGGDNGNTTKTNREITNIA